MSKIHRNEGFFNQNPITSINKFFPKDSTVDFHYHSRGQLVYADEGIMELYIHDTYWLLPSSKGIYIPPQCNHKMRAKTDVYLKTLYINEENFDLPNETTGIYISALLRELIVQAANIPNNYLKNSFEDKLLQFTIEVIIQSQNNLFYLPLGKDSRIQSLCHYLLQNPTDNRILNEWAESLGASSRTLIRLFKKETGLSYTIWRENLKVLHAINLLTNQKPISYISSSLGYSSQSAFSVMFKRITNMTPKQYFKTHIFHNSTQL